MFHVICLNHFLFFLARFSFYWRSKQKNCKHILFRLMKKKLKWQNGRNMNYVPFNFFDRVSSTRKTAHKLPTKLVYATSQTHFRRSETKLFRSRLLNSMKYLLFYLKFEITCTKKLKHSSQRRNVSMPEQLFAVLKYRTSPYYWQCLQWWLYSSRKLYENKHENGIWILPPPKKYHASHMEKKKS